MRTLADGADLRVDETPHVREERRVADGLGEHADPALRGDQVRSLVEFERSVDVSEEPVAVGFVTTNTQSKPGNELVEKTAQELRLVFEMMMDETGGHSGSSGHGCDRRAGIAVIREHPGERGKQLSTALLAIAGTSHKLVV